MQSQEENTEFVIKDISAQENQIQNQATEIDDMDDELGFNNFGKFENQQELERQFK